MKRTVCGLLVAASLLGCAKKGRPGGGPEDKTGPFLALWSPVAGADSLALDTPVVLTWSEPVQRATVEDRIVVSPDTTRIDIAWEGATVTILPRGGWLPDLVHWVWIGPGVLDRHGLPMPEAFGLWFSTGGISSGRIEGTALAGGSPAAGAVITMFTDGSPLRWMCLTDAIGVFTAGLTPGAWHVEAFLDRDGDRVYRRGIEPWASLTLEVPPDSAISVQLEMAPEDTAPPVVREVRVAHSREVRIGFSEALSAAPDSGFTLRDTTGFAYPIRAVSLSAADPAGVRLLLEAPMRDDLMLVTASGVRDSAGLSLTDTTLTVLGTSLADTVPPEVYRLLHDEPSSRVWILFSEPMEESGKDSLTVRDALDFVSIPGAARWHDPQVLAWSASVPQPHRRMMVALSGARDPAGNLLRPPLVAMIPAPGDEVLPAWEKTQLPP